MEKWNTMHDIKVQLKIPKGGNGPVGPLVGALASARKFRIQFNF
jgi:hypothetical protein